MRANRKQPGFSGEVRGSQGGLILLRFSWIVGERGGLMIKVSRSPEQVREKERIF